MNLTMPSVSCVVIGINCEKTILRCLESLKRSLYPKIVEIFYVDGGSKDSSISYAKQIQGVKIIELKSKNPTPGKGRNAGWKAASGDWIHFFDSDTIADENWISEAIKHINEKTAAIFGRRKEIYPHKNRFHFFADLEWIDPTDKPRFFGGDVLIKRSVLAKVGGYEEGLIAGEDPELSTRIRHKGWQIIGVDALMCYHDIDIDSWNQYFKRSFRSGYGYAAAGIKMLKFGEKEWFLRSLKIVFKGSLVFCLIFFAIFSRFYISAIAGLFVAFFPLLETPYFKNKFKISFKDSIAYAFHCSIVVWPQFFAILKYDFKLISVKK